MNDKYYFLEHDKAQEIFAKTDYWLKSGYHIQYKHPDQQESCRYIQDVYNSLRRHYNDFYDVDLTAGGDEIDHSIYYFIEYRKHSNTQYSRKHFGLFDEDRLEPDVVIVGLLLSFMEVLDSTSSISQVQQALNEEHDEFKNGFYKLLANNSSGGVDLHKDEVQVNNRIAKALKYFEKIKWLYFPKADDDRFEIMPSFDRFTKVLYRKEIEEFDTIFKTNKS